MLGTARHATVDIAPNAMRLPHLSSLYGLNVMFFPTDVLSQEFSHNLGRVGPIRCGAAWWLPQVPVPDVRISALGQNQLLSAYGDKVG